MATRKTKVSYTYDEDCKVVFNFYDKGDYILVTGESTCEECMGDWGQIEMRWEEFISLNDKERVYLAEQSVC